MERLQRITVSAPPLSPLHPPLLGGRGRHPSRVLGIYKPHQDKCVSAKKKPSPDFIVLEIKSKTHHKFSAEEKIRIILEGLRGEQSITDLCRREGIHSSIYYKWNNAFHGQCKQHILNRSISSLKAVTNV